jgi:PhnB protein
MGVKAVPDGYHTINSMLVVKDPEGLISFCEQVFKGKCSERVNTPDGQLMHAEVQVGDSTLMLGQAMEQWPESTGTLYLYLEDVDETYQRAIAAGAKSLGEPKDQFWGDRMGGFSDANGINWWVARHVEDVAPEELQSRMEKHMAEKQQEGGQAQAA